jgi:hypothetical protein
MSLPGWHNGWSEAELDDIPEDQGFVAPNPIGLVGGLPYQDTYIIRRQGDMVLTPTGWYHIEDMP